MAKDQHRGCRQKATEAELECSVDNIMQRAVKRGLARRKVPQSARHLCVDEVAFKKGHKYVTVISDTQGQTLALTDDRGVESLAGYLRSLAIAR